MYRRDFLRLFSIPIYGSLFLGVGCGGGSESKPPSNTLIGAVPEAEFRSVEAPRYENAQEAIKTVLTNDRTLIDDKLRFSRALFNELKRQSRAEESDSKPWEKHLTNEEFEILISDPISAISFPFAAVQGALSAEANYPCGQSAPIPFNDDKSDAVRHAYSSALIARRSAIGWDLILNSAIITLPGLGAEIGLQFAERIGTAHENRANNPVRRKAMDLSNNAAGRRVFREYPNASEAELLILVMSLPFEFVAANEEVTFDDTRLVYIVNQAPFDGSWTGTLTNPDSGGPWNVTFYFNQCGNVIRGEYHGRRDTSTGKRRFTGTVQGETVTLNVATPFEWEAPPGLVPCSNVVSQLTQQGTTLSGSWTSSTCRRGGVTTLSKDTIGRGIKSSRIRVDSTNCACAP
jgi:hypothetical protein